MTRKKLLLVINNFMVGGVERLLRDILPQFNSDLVDITVVTVWGSGPLAATYQSRGWRIFWAAGRIWYSNKNPLLKPYFTIVAPLTFVRLFLIIKRIKPDVVMTCLTQADIIGIAAARLAGVPQRVIRQADVKPLQPMIGWLKRQLAIRSATKIIANSTSTKQFTESYFGVAADRVVVLPNGIDIARFQQPGSTLSTRQDLTVGFLGRLEEIKGPQYFMEAVRLLKEQYHLNPPVLVFGDGSLSSEMQEYAINHQLTNVNFSGQILDPAASLSSIDILVVPSQSEGFGLVVLEGLAGGKVVVASDLPAVNDLITNQVNGLLFPMGDAAHLARQLSNLLQNPTLVGQLQQGAKQWLADTGWRYDIRAVAAAYQQQLITGQSLDRSDLPPMRKKIVFIINTLMVGGVERLICDVATHLDRDQWEPRVVTVLGSGPLLSEFQRRGIPIEVVGPKRYYPNSVPYRLYWLLTLPAILWRLLRALKRQRPLVVVTSLYHADIVGMLVAQHLKIQHRVIIHHDVERLPRFIAWAKRRLALPRATQIVANSKTVSEFLQKYFAAPADKLIIIPNGIDTQHFAGGRKTINDLAPVVGMVARLEPIKGPGTFVAALSILRNQPDNQTVTTLLAGGGSLQTQLQAQAQMDDLNLLFLGEVMDVVPVLQQIDILVIPSLAEGFGLVVVEGLVARKLIVASDLPAIRELIVDGQNGLLFPPSDPIALASQIHRLLSDADLRNRISLGVKQWSDQESANYDINRVTQRYQDLWRQ